MNIVVTNVKGGVGKTTTTMYLAAAAASRGREAVLVIDADRQASSAEWFDAMPLDEVELVEAPSERTVTRAMGRHGGIAVVDTPPGDERIVRAAIAAADAVVIPTRAGGVETSRPITRCSAGRSGVAAPEFDRGRRALGGSGLRFGSSPSASPPVATLRAGTREGT